MGTKLVLGWVLLTATAFGGGSSSAQAQQKKEGNIIDLKDLAAVGKPFKVAPYLRAAAVLQKMGKEQARKQLESLAEKDDAGRIAILCRMLFANKPDSTFRPPRLGDPVCLGGSGPADWPLLPIEIVDGVPFFVVRSYRLGGEPESSLHYLNYCIQNCAWSNTRFDLVSDEALTKALNKLLASPKWKRPLTEPERQFLSSQIK
jgi:hypothetical protein